MEKYKVIKQTKKNKETKIRYSQVNKTNHIIDYE